MKITDIFNFRAAKQPEQPTKRHKKFPQGFDS